jgi:hypothetical protein
MSDPGHERTKQELSRYARGSRGSPQRMFRMYLWMGMRNFYSSNRWSESPTREAVIAWVIAATRERYPGFEPEEAISAT